MHFNRIGCRLHNRPRRIRPHSRAPFFRTGISPTPRDIFPLSFPRSSFFFRPGKRSRFFVRLGKREKFRTNDRIWFIFRRPIEFCDDESSTLPVSQDSIALRSAQRADDRCADESSQLRFLVGIGSSQVDCVYAESNDVAGDIRDTCRAALLRENKWCAMIALSFARNRFEYIFTQP